MKTHLIAKVSLIILVLSAYACELEDIIEQPPLSFVIDHTKNPASNEVSFTITVRLANEPEFTNKKLHFSAGDNTLLELTNPRIVEDDEKLTMTYETSHTYAGPGGYSVVIWLDEIPLQKFTKEIVLDPFAP